MNSHKDVREVYKKQKWNRWFFKTRVWGGRTCHGLFMMVVRKIFMRI